MVGRTLYAGGNFTRDMSAQPVRLWSHCCSVRTDHRRRLPFDFERLVHGQLTQPASTLAVPACSNLRTSDRRHTCGAGVSAALGWLIPIVNSEKQAYSRINTKRRRQQHNKRGPGLPGHPAHLHSPPTTLNASPAARPRRRTRRPRAHRTRRPRAHRSPRLHLRLPRPGPTACCARSCHRC